MERGEKLPVRGCIAPPADFHNVEKGAPFLKEFHVLAHDGTTGLRSVQYQAADSLWMASGISHSDQTAARLCNQDKVLEASGLYDCFQILDVFLQREFDGLPIGKATPAPVIADHRMTFRQQRKPWAPDRALPIEVE